MSHTPGRVLDRFPGYTVTDDGRVYSVASNWRGYGIRELGYTLNEDGYPSVRLYDRDGKRRRMAVYQLVAMAWLEMPSIGQQIRHLDGDKANSHWTNLKWGSAKENADDRESHGRTSRGLSHSLAIKTGLARIAK